MTFNEFCLNNFVNIKPMQRHYIDIVDNDITPRKGVRYFNYNPNMRSGGLTTIKCAHAAWILQENPASRILLICERSAIGEMFRNNVSSSFGADGSRITSLINSSISSGYYPRGIKFDFVFSECEKIPKDIVATMLK